MTGSGSVCARNGAPLRAAAFAAGALMLAMALAACGGGSSATGGPETPPPPVLSERDQARVTRLGALHEHADALTMTGLTVRWSLAAEGEDDIEAAFVEPVTCTGVRCAAADGAVTAARDLLDLSDDATGAGAGTGNATLAERGGFDTVRTTGAFAVTETLPDLALTVSPEATSWGFWGERGFAALTLGTGPLAAEVSGTAFHGRFSSAQAWAAGDASGSNPAGTGSAVWTGIAEASDKEAFGRAMGTATLRIEDLAQPAVDVVIALDGTDTPLRWDDLRLADGRFAAGTAGTDRLEGRFHGPAHEETYGVFDTEGWIGAFGARRTP